MGGFREDQGVGWGLWLLKHLVLSFTMSKVESYRSCSTGAVAFLQMYRKWKDRKNKRNS